MRLSISSVSSNPAGRIMGLLAIGSLSACSPLGSPGAQTQFTDSAGITIAESAEFPQMGAGGWTPGQTPTLSVGALEGESEYQFFGVSSGVKLSDGRIAVTDLGTHQLRVYAPDGTFLKSFGREGEGPGEFRHIRVMGTIGSDTLVLMDGRQRRTSRYHPDVGFLGQTLLPEEAGITMHFNGMFGDGSIVFGGGVDWDRGEEESSPAGYERLANRFFSVSLDGAGFTQFGEFPGTEVIWMQGSYAGRQTLAAGFPHFGLSPRAKARGNRLYLGTRDRYEIMAFDASGELTRTFRFRTPPVAVTEEHLEGLQEETLARLPDPDLAPQIRTSFRETPHAETMPAFQDLFVDSEGCLWVEDYHVPGDTLRTWTVFNRDGGPLTRLSLPQANRVLGIGANHLLAAFEDELDVEYVRLYPLTRGDG